MSSLKCLQIMLIVGVLSVLGPVGCSSLGKKMKSFLGGNPSAEASPQSRTTGAKFSENPDLAPSARRQYRRTTRQTLSEESSLDSKSGSLWSMEGQGAFLFAENIMRMIGDPIAVAIEGEPREQLETKVDVIRKLIAKFEERQQARMRQLASDNEDSKDKTKDGKDSKDGKEGKAAATSTPAPPQDKREEFAVKIVPTRIVERTTDGNYRIKGTQPFMISSREYRVIVTGIVRAEDFNEKGISATQLIDSKLDVVSVRRKEQEL